MSDKLFGSIPWQVRGHSDYSQTTAPETGSTRYPNKLEIREIKDTIVVSTLMILLGNNNHMLTRGDLLPLLTREQAVAR